MSPGSFPTPCGIDAIAGGYGQFQCFAAADEMQKALVLGLVQGIRIELAMPRFGGLGTMGCIYADEGRYAGRIISSNGRHVGIVVGGMVYDNNFCLGVLRADWLEKMQTQFGTVSEAVGKGIIVLSETAF